MLLTPKPLGSITMDSGGIDASILALFISPIVLDCFPGAQGFTGTAYFLSMTCSKPALGSKSLYLVISPGSFPNFRIPDMKLASSR